MPNDSDKSNRSLLIGLVAVFWIGISLAGYYYTHKPFNIDLLTETLIVLWRLIVAAGIISISGGLGGWLLSERTNFPALTGMTLQAALGAGCFGLLVLLMGMTIGFHPLYFAILGIILIGLLQKHILTWAQQWMQISVLFKSRISILLAVMTGIILFWTLTSALTPPLYFDALTYHLALPHSYLLTGKLAYDPNNMFWGMPQQIEMLFTFAMALAGTEAATTLGWGFGLLTLIGLLDYVTEKINLTAGWISIACLMGGFSLATSLASGYLEWSVMLFGFGMLVAIDTWRSSSEKKYLILAAIFAGFALGTKYTAGELNLIGLVIIAWDGIRKRDSRTLSLVLLFGAVATMVSLPWWIKNWLATSNPFYPLFWPAGSMTQARLDFYNIDYWGSWLDVLTLPWQVTVWGVEGKEGFSWSIGPLLLGFSVLSLIGWQARKSEQKRLLSTTVIITLTGFIVWAIASRWNGYLIQTRLYTAIFPAWAILGGFGVDSLSKLRAGTTRFGRIAVIIVVFTYALNLVEVGTVTIHRSPISVLSGNETPASYWSRNLGSYQVAMTALGELPPDSKVLMLWETRNLACLPICDPDEVIDRWYDESHKYASPEEILAAWRAQDYTHMLLYVNGKNFVQKTDERFNQNDWEKLDALLKIIPTPKVVAPGYDLYPLTVE